MQNNIILVGFMGVGKSVAAKELAKRLKKEIVSTDKFIENKLGCSINEIFAKFGEDYFRKVEEEAVETITKRNNIIIDCGGGIFTKQKNIDHLKKNGIIFYLMASVETILQRTKNSKHRPLLNTHEDNLQEKILELLKQREPFYKQAHYRIDTNSKTNSQVCGEIQEIIK